MLSGTRIYRKRVQRQSCYALNVKNKKNEKKKKNKWLCAHTHTHTHKLSLTCLHQSTNLAWIFIACIHIYPLSEHYTRSGGLREIRSFIFSKTTCIIYNLQSESISFLCVSVFLCFLVFSVYNLMSGASKIGFVYI